MKPEERQFWLKNMQDRVIFAKELEVWLEDPITQKIMEGMIDVKIKLLKIIDDPKKMINSPEVIDARQKRMNIQWFLESIVMTASGGKRAQEEIEKYQKFEKEKEEKQTREVAA